MGRALLGKALDDEVSVPRPRGRAEFLIRAVRYRDPPDVQK